MARKQPVDPVKHAAETQAERLRALAEEMRTYAVGRRDEAMFTAWANTVQFCSESLIKAVKAEDHRWRDTMLDFAKGTAKLAINTVVTTAVAVGVTTAIASDAPPADAEKLLECANLVVEQAETIEDLRLSEQTATHTMDSPHDGSGTPFNANVPFNSNLPFNGEPIATAEQPSTATEEALQTYGRGFEGNRVQYGERDENNRPISSGSVELPEPSVVEDLDYIDSDLASVGPGQPEKSLQTLQIRKLMGVRLRELRKLLGWRLEQVADEYAVSVPRIANIESGKTNQDDLADYVGAIRRSERFQGAEPRARELMDEIVSLLEQSRPS